MRWSARRRVSAFLCSWVLLAASASPLSAQYFGRNKVQYEDLHFKVLKTEHFDVYYYPDEAAAAQQAGRMAERWYGRLSTILDHKLSGRQPIILYATMPQFQQTNVVGGIGEGTGGVTEALMRRIVLPTGGTLTDMDHVIGHELVFDQLLGSRLLIGNLELRFPLFGLLGAGSGYYGILPLDWLVFADGGVAWDSQNDPSLTGGNRDAVFSGGTGFRFNLFGFAVAEVDLIKPFDRPNKGWVWEFHFLPGF